MHYGAEMKSEEGRLCVTHTPTLPRGIRVIVTPVARPLLVTAAQNLCRCEHGVAINTVCSLSNTTSLQKVCCCSEASSISYPYKEMRFNIALHGLVTTFRNTEVFVCDRRSSSGKTVETAAVPISSSASNATTG